MKDGHRGRRLDLAERPHRLRRLHLHAARRLLCDVKDKPAPSVGNNFASLLMDHQMPTESGAAFLAAKSLGLKAVMGMVGAALLFASAPPVKKDGTFDRVEFVARLATAGIFSMVFGQWAVDLFMEFYPRLGADKHPAAVYLLTGAPAWWVSRWAAVWLHKRRNKDLGEVIDEVRS